MKILKLAAAAFAAAALAGSSAAAQSGTTIQWHFVYYDDAIHSNAVGETVIYCDGTAWGWGNLSAYYTETHNEC